MDKATLFGFILGFGAVIVAIMMGGSLGAFVDVPGMIICFGGTFAAAMVAFPMSSVLSAGGTLMHCFKVKVPECKEEIARFSDYAAIVRREGLLGLEAKIAAIRDPFLKRGLEMVIDNAPREKMEETMSIEIQCLHERHSIGKKIFENAGAMAPAFGMVGTLIGLIQMLGSLDDPSKIGTGMAVAMVTTFYGAFLSNMVFLPLATKLETRSKEEVQVRELMLHGLLGLLEGESPRAIEAKLKSYLSPKTRDKKEAAKPEADAA